jgi:hypothetical protein
MPALLSERRMTDPNPLGPLNPQIGALSRKKTRRLALRGARLLQVVDDRLANVRWQRKVVALTILATHADLPGDPIDIIEFERN